MDTAAISQSQKCKEELETQKEVGLERANGGRMRLRLKRLWKLVP